jgi:type IV secretory pathway VirB3-like protein
MIASILRLFALRPLFSLMIFGFPLLLLVAVGLFAIIAFKALFLFVLPVLLVVWLVRKIARSADSSRR